MDTMMMNKMMGTMPSSTMGVDMASMQECIEACDAVAMAATMCADADMAAGMGRCASMCTNMADVATTMMRMMLRPMAHDAMAMRAMLDASMAMCQACMDECSQHADTMECCRICVMACQNMKDACGALMAKMA